MTHPFFAASPRPRLFAHRGLVDPGSAGDEIVENSFAAVAAAHAVGATYIESDCHVTSDGEVVLFHDSGLGRVTGDPRQVDQVTVRQLDALMAGRGGLITLAQALDAFPLLRFNLDVKVDGAADAVGRVVAAEAHRVLLTSFSDPRRRAAVVAAQRFGAEVLPATSPGTRTIAELVLATKVRSRRWVRRVLAGVDAVQIPERHRGVQVLSDQLIELVHDAGVEVHVWTVNDVDHMRALVSRGVDGIVTDRVDLGLRAFATPT